MSLTVGGILERIERGVEVSTIAPVMRRLVALRNDEQESKALLALVSCDPALTLRLMTAANAPGSYESPVTSVQDAFARIGFQKARHLALTTAFIDEADSPTADNTSFILQWLWERSLAVAVASEVLNQAASGASKQEVRTMGLLLDIGIPFLLSVIPEDYAPILERWKSEGGDLAEIESELLGIDHAIVGHQLAKSLQLGEQIEAAIRDHHHRPEESSHPELQKILQLARLSAAVMYENRHMTGMERAVRFAQEHFGMERNHYVDALQTITLLADAGAVRISKDAGPVVPYVELLRHVNAELGRATLTYEQMVRELEIAMQKAETLTLKLEEANKKLREVANVDPLTHIYNRRFFEEFLDWNFKRTQRYGTPLGCMMLDIDYFKRVNDNYGHLTGDLILQGVAETLKANLRSTDILARFGGEEFIILLPETGPEAVATAAAKLNYAVKNHIFRSGKLTLKVTISIGHIAYSPTLAPDINAPADLIQAADRYMYQAKENGRDQIWPAKSKPKERRSKVRNQSTKP